MICSECYREYRDKNIKTCTYCKNPIVEDCVIKNVVVKNLFNKNDYEISFYNKKKVSILIAPNGFGKSTIFNFIDFVYNPSIKVLEQLSRIPFDSFTINFINGGFVTLEKNKEELLEWQKKYNFTLSGKLSGQTRNTIKINIFKDFVEARMYSLSRLEEIDKQLDFEIKNIFENKKSNIKPLNGLYLNLKRLEIEDSTIKQLTKLEQEKEDDKISHLISNKDNSTNISVYSYRVKQIVELENEFKKILEEAQGCENDGNKNPDFVESIKRLRKKIKEDLKKLKGIKKLLDLFCKVYNERNKKSGKKISYDETGFVIKDGKNQVPLECLSDGEKNDFCVFFNLIYFAKDLENYDRPTNQYSLLIIDEPEVSLHIEWQETWLEYILKICEKKDVQVIIATHSPFIVNANFDLYAKKKVKKHVAKEK